MIVKMKFINISGPRNDIDRVTTHTFPNMKSNWNRHCLN